MANVTKLNIGGTDYDIVDASVPNWAKQSTKPTYTASEISGLANVATSGSYNDLSDKPTIPVAVTVDSTITQNGTNPVQGGAIYSALEGKTDKPIVVEIVDWGTYNEDSYGHQEWTGCELSFSYQEIMSAWNSGRQIYISDGENLYSLVGDPSEGYVSFSSFGWESNTTQTVIHVYSDNSALIVNKNNVVKTTRTINGKALSSNITLSASDVGADVFVVNIESDGNDGYNCDKTNAEIYAAWSNGRDVIADTDSGYIYHLCTTPTLSTAMFSGLMDELGRELYDVRTKSNVQTVTYFYDSIQRNLISGTNIKTINNQSLLGSGNIEIESGGNVTVENVTDTGDVIKSLEPNIFYKFGTVNSLTIPLISGTDLAVYSGKFTIDSQSTAQSFFVVPATVITAYSCPTITAGNTYEFNILDNVLMMQEI